MLYHYAGCRILFIIMLNVIMLNVIMLNVIMLNVIMLSVVAPSSQLYTNILQLAPRIIPCSV